MERFINDIGGSGVIAKELGLKQSAVSMWRKNGIPWKFRNWAADKAKKKGVPLPEKFLDPLA